MEYSVEQKCWSAVWFGMSGSPTAVQREYRRKFGRHAQLPNDKTIRRSWEKFLETGSLNKKPKTKTKWIRTELKIEEVLAKFREDPHISTRSLARNEGMPSRRTIQRILKVHIFLKDVHLHLTFSLSLFRMQNFIPTSFNTFRS